MFAQTGYQRFFPRFVYSLGAERIIDHRTELGRKLKWNEI